MTRVVVLGLLLFALSATMVQSQLERFGDALDGIDVDKILASRRLVENYVQCFIHKRPCPSQIAAIKRDFPEIVKTTCGRCTRGQLLKISEALSKFRKLYPGEYQKVAQVWDPTDEHFKKFEVKAKSLMQQGR